MTSSFPLKICLAGKNQIAIDALLYIIRRGWKDRLIVCPNRTDTGTSTWQPSLVRFAREHNIEVVNLEYAQETDGLVFLSLEFDRIVQPAAFRTNKLFNIHFSALPAYKGMFTSTLPILHGASHSGVTLHEIDPGIDTGRIIAQTKFDLPDTWTARDLYFAYMDYGIALFRENFDRLVSSEQIEATQQPWKGSSYYSKSAIDFRNLSINLRDTADGIVRQLRAFSFREYQTPVIDGLRVGGWEILPEASRERPGTVVCRDSSGLTVATVDYQLRLSRFSAWDWFTLTADRPSDGFDQAFIDVFDINGWTPLIRAAYAGDAILCRRLLEAGADPNRANTNGTSPLMYAASSPDRGGGLQAIQQLLEFGADPERVDYFGRSLRDYHPNIRLVLSKPTKYGQIGP